MGGKKVVSIDVSVVTGERLNSPRSLEACRRMGIEPEELLPKTVADFLVKNGKYSMVEKEAAVLRHQHFEQLRQSKLVTVRRERELIVQGDNAQQSKAQSPQSKGDPRRTQSARPWKQMTHTTSHSVDDEPNGSDSTMVQLEEKRLSRMKMRQKLEIQAMIENEAKAARLQLENARRAAEEARRREEYEKNLRTRRTQMMVTKHEREIEKKKQEDREAAQRRLRAKQEAEKEKLHLEEVQRRQEEAKQEAFQRELERNTKAEEFRRQTEALLQQQEDIVAANRLKMLEKEKLVLANMESVTKKRHQEAQARREKAEARLQHAQLQNQLAIQKKKQEFDEKQATAMERAKDIQKKTIAELKERSLKSKQEEEIRQKRLEAARMHREQHVVKLQLKRHEQEEKMEKALEERERERFLQTVEKQLTSEEKQQNVDRLKRMEEYTRMQLLRRIAEEDERSRAIKAKKQALMEARQRVTLESMLRKHRISEAVENLRQSNKWDQIETALYDI